MLTRDARMTDGPTKKTSFPVLKIRLLALINYDPVNTSLAKAIAQVLVDELRGPDKTVTIDSLEIGRRVGRCSRTQISEAIGILGPWTKVKRRKHGWSEYGFPLIRDP